MSILDDDDWGLDDGPNMPPVRHDRKSKASERATLRSSVTAAEAKSKPQLISATYLVHLLGGQLVVGQIERYASDPAPYPRAGLRISNPYEVFVIPPVPEDEKQTNRVAVVKYGRAGGALPTEFGCDHILVGNNALRIMDPPRDLFDHYIKAMEQDRQAPC